MIVLKRLFPPSGILKSVAWTLLIWSLGIGFNPTLAQDPSQEEIKKVIDAFVEKETAFREAWLNYTYSQSLEMKVVSVDGRPSRESFRMDSEVYFDDSGRRKFKVTRRNDRLKSIQFTREDEDVIHNLQPFVLTKADLQDYQIQFRRKETVDQVDCFVFAIEPKRTTKGKFYFKGHIWVDDRDFQVVMSRGKTIPEPRGQKFPEFETRRELIDSKFWFPTWTEARDTLRFGGGNDVEIHEVVTYDNYRRFEVDTKIRYGNPTQPPQ